MKTLILFLFLRTGTVSCVFERKGAAFDDTTTQSWSPTTANCKPDYTRRPERIVVDSALDAAYQVFKVDGKGYLIEITFDEEHGARIREVPIPKLEVQNEPK